ncbi:MAG: OmpH family outer membrane protein [Bryobacteraceae bacterium]|jgi:outer membrane protein
MFFRTGLGPLAACCALFFIPQGAAAQVKVAVVNMQQALADSAEIQKIQADMQAKYKPRQAEIDKVTADGAALQKQVQDGQNTLAPQAMADLQAQIARCQRELQRLNEDFQADIERDRNDILSKCSQKMSAVVKKLAEERGIDVVVDVSTSIYYKPALDITKDVIAAYDQAYPVKPAAPATPAGK